MITAPNGKKLMNLQEAVQWLLNNNAIPFQCRANYIAGAEIGLGTIVNPSPAKVRVGSLIFFADSKVSTVIALTSNSFICSDEYNDLVDDVVYVSNVQLNASGHLIVTLSNGTNIDAGLIKQISSFSINASQHLIVSYNDGTSTDLGAIFSGNITISGNLTVIGGISGNAITGDSIIENMTGYFLQQLPPLTNLTKEYVYCGMVKNGNKLTCVMAIKLTRTDTTTGWERMGALHIPESIGQKLYPTQIGVNPYLDVKVISAFSEAWAPVDLAVNIEKVSDQILEMKIASGLNNLTLNTPYYVRYEVTFLLSDNLAS